MAVVALKQKPLLKTFHATVHVTRVEQWCVEAETAEEARELLTAGAGPEPERPGDPHPRFRSSPQKPLNYDRLWIGCSVLLQRLGGGGTWSSRFDGALQLTTLDPLWPPACL